MNALMTPDEIRSLISTRLHSEAHLSVYPDTLPAPKVARIRRLHRSWLPDDEPILALYDDTLLGSGADGFALTTRRLVWRSFLGHPRQIRWTDLDPAAVDLDDGDLMVAESRLSTGSITQISELAGLIAELGDRHRGGDLPADSDPLSPAVLIKLARWYIGELPSVFYAPALPPRKLHGVRRTHRLPDDERVLAIIDDTLLGSASEGIVLTSERVCWKHLLDPPDAMRWSELKPRADGRPVITGLQLTLHPGVLPRVHELLGEVADELTAITGRVYCWSCRGEVRLHGGRCGGCGRLVG
jgi:hypothetical protein